ncbi:MAG: hypothetical protein IPL61_37880 [Myxococcales bacterium]|nr:hypothetical protein [Myxococcales bacterium]
MRASALVAVTLLGLMTAATVAVADDQFHPVPAAPGQRGDLALRVVGYGHGVHGEMTVEVRNGGADAATFVASGLYFLPDDDGGEAPQRLTIVGGIRAGSEDAPSDAIAVAAGTTRKMRFDVYCIDESRHAPSSSQAFTLAANRMPPRLSAAITVETAAVVGRLKLRASDEQQSSIQSRVWQARRLARARLLGDHR